MSEPLKIGDALQAAREAKGWTVQDAANRLRLMARQVEAMESEDYAALGQPVFARGFVRNYARLLGIDPEPLLTRMSESGAAPAEKADTGSYAPETASGISPILIGMLAALALLLVIPAAIYLWLNSGEDEAPSPQSVQTGQSAPQAPVSSQPEPTSALPAVPSVVPDTAAHTAPTPVPAPVVVLKPEPEAAPLSKPAQEPAQPKPESHSAPAADAAAPEASANPYLPANFRHKSIRLQFDQDAWVQIKDGNGRTIHSTLNKAGSTVELNGKPPFDFVVGNAANVRMTYSGRPFDIKPYIGETVARFTLE